MVCLGRGAGQREDRYMHLLGGPVSASEHLAASAGERTSSGGGGMAARVEALEVELAELREQLAALTRRLDGQPADTSGDSEA